jgi:hypothetical protein
VTSSNDSSTCSCILLHTATLMPGARARELDQSVRAPSHSPRFSIQVCDDLHTRVREYFTPAHSAAATLLDPVLVELGIEGTPAHPEQSCCQRPISLGADKRLGDRAVLSSTQVLFEGPDRG